MRSACDAGQFALLTTHFIQCLCSPLLPTDDHVYLDGKIIFFYVRVSTCDGYHDGLNLSGAPKHYGYINNKQVFCSYLHALYFIPIGYTTSTPLHSCAAKPNQGLMIFATETTIHWAHQPHFICSYKWTQTSEPESCVFDQPPFS